MLSPGRRTSAQRAAAARPNTTRSISEFDPRRLAPCTDTQAASPSDIRPGTAKSSLPFFLVNDNSVSFTDRMPYVTGLPGLYAGSAGAHPAGSVIGAAGHNAAQRILADLGVVAR